ncbi:MAG: lysophospholipid acyltransferase family protein, partial [Acidimicrobiales bacterium]
MPRTTLTRPRPARPLPKLRASFPWVAPTWPTTLERTISPKVGVHYDTAWARRYGVRLVRALVMENLTRPALRALADPTVHGLDRLEHTDGPVVFAANHASHLDVPLILTSLPARLRHRTVVSAAADYFFDRPWKAAVSAGLIGAIPTERLRVNRRSMDVAAQLLAEGWSLVFFPEGGRSPDGWARDFGAGAAYLASRAGVPVVPVHVEGTGDILGKRRPG